ncbi:Tn3 family transposase [Dactylosporangium sp. CA-233914]|uniref:Tn3 family transposase n=1 Tax=Dactylosporangium sp. CA-233914 TaxID=3239934 RepID=UPI003D9392D5
MRRKICRLWSDFVRLRSGEAAAYGGGASLSAARPGAAGGPVVAELIGPSDIQPDIIHADAQGQSLPVFGLTAPLGFELLPRIRNQVIDTITLLRVPVRAGTAGADHGDHQQGRGAPRLLRMAVVGGKLIGHNDPTTRSSWSSSTS